MEDRRAVIDTPVENGEWKINDTSVQTERI